MSRPPRVAALTLTLLVLAPAAWAHETLHEVVQGKAVAVKAYFVDGEALAYTPCEVFSPTDSKIPWQKGRTDRDGYVTFLPSVPGAWRVRVTDDTGHGLDVTVDVPAEGRAAPAANGGEAVGTLAFVLRPLVGLALVALVFAGLTRAYRRREKRS